ncbi:uncharacterized protein LOC142242762 [Haematobia irritans]|uniref:uncharacterized protein LOC142242762 n=1 Tax=Haematobia irritans TaxID=7368 RepID=UPI003F4F59BB
MPKNNNEIQHHGDNLTGGGREEASSKMVNQQKNNDEEMDEMSGAEQAYTTVKSKKKGSKRRSDDDHHYIALKYEAKIRELTSQLNASMEHIRNLKESVKTLTEQIAGGNVSINVNLPDDWNAELASGRTQANIIENNLSAEYANGLSTANIEEMDTQVAPPATRSTGTIPKITKKSTPQMSQRTNTGIGENRPAASTATNTNMTAGKNENKGKASPPIIKIYNVNVKEFAQEIRTVLGHNIFSMNIINKNLIGLVLGTEQDHMKVRSHLELKKYNFFTFTPKTLKPYSLMIKGLSETYEVEDLLDFIKEKKLQVTVTNVIKMQDDRWIVQLDRESDIKSFRKLRYLINNRVQMRRRKKKGITQCKNCQRFGHSSINCRMPFRCVKCGDSHGPGNCVIPKKDLDVVEVVITNPETGQVEKRIGHTVRCVNCGVDGHVASARDCPRRMEILRKRTERRRAVVAVPQAQRARVQTTVSAEPRIGGNNSYAAVAARNNTNTARGANVADMVNVNLKFFDDECNRLFGGNFLDSYRKIAAYMNDYKGLRTDDERARAMIGLLATMTMK